MSTMHDVLSDLARATTTERDKGGGQGSCHVKVMRFAKSGSSPDGSTIFYNRQMTCAGIPDDDPTLALD